MGITTASRGKALEWDKILDPLTLPTAGLKQCTGRGGGIQLMLIGSMCHLASSSGLYLRMTQSVMGRGWRGGRGGQMGGWRIGRMGSIGWGAIGI
jgi:hypothetical protein